jgi:hypothetical protein
MAPTFCEHPGDVMWVLPLWKRRPIRPLALWAAFGGGEILLGISFVLLPVRADVKWFVVVVAAIGVVAATLRFDYDRQRMRERRGANDN